MAVKTITITEKAYNALKAQKQPGESFSKAILRTAAKRSIWDFRGALSPESADRLEKTIRENRLRATKEYEQRVQLIAKKLSEGRSHGNSRKLLSH